MKTGELARVAQCTVETVRYYEKEGLLPAPLRTAGNYRSFGDAHVERLRFIRNCRTLDMAHEEIRRLLGLLDRPVADCGGVNQLLEEHIRHVEVRIDELARLKDQLLALRNQCQDRKSIGACGILHGLAAMEAEPRHERLTHLG